jgi:hypothetical protein
MMDIARGEKVEKELDHLITRRHEKRRVEEGETAEEALWRESVRHYEEQQSRQRLWEELRYHEAMVRTHTANAQVIVGRHREEVARCEELLGLNGHKGGA